MARTLAHGRLTKQDPGEAFRRSGLIAALGNKGIFGNHMDQLLFEAHGYEHILGSVSQVASDFATMTWDQAQQRFEDKSGSEVVLSHYDRIAVMGMDTLTDNIELDNLTGLEIFHIGNTPGQTGDNPKFQLGDAGGGEPFKIKLGPNTRDCKLDLLTDKPFEELLRTLTLDQKRYIANQGRDNHIRVNGRQIYNPSRTGEIAQFDALPANPYLVRMDGGMNHWIADASNVSLAWFRDLNIFLDGLRSDGTVLQETNSRFTNPAIIAATPWFFQVNSVYRFLTDLSDADTRTFDRDSPTIVLGLVADFVLNSDVVTFVDFVGSGYEGDAKNNMRIYGPAEIPAVNTATTLLVDINTTTHTARLIDALTGDPVLATGNATNEVVLVNNSGAAAGSRDEDTFQNITGQLDIRASDTPPLISSDSGALNYTAAGGTGTSQPITSTGVAVPRDLLEFDASDSLGSNSHDQTQPRSTAVRFYYKA